MTSKNFQIGGAGGRGARLAVLLMGKVRVLKKFVILFMLTLSITACTNASVPIAKLQTPLTDVEFTSSLSGEVVEGGYITAYSNIALGLRQCWLGDKMPLQKAQFFARNKAKGQDRKSDIFVHGPAIHPKRGPRIFSVHLKPRGKNTEVRMDNRLLDHLNEARLTKDLRRWIEGKKGCLAHNSNNEITPDKVASKKPLLVKKAANKKSGSKKTKPVATNKETLPWKK